MCVCVCVLVNSLEETLQYFRTVEIGEEINTLAYFCAPTKVCCRNKLTLNQTEQPHRTDRKTARQAADIDSNKGRDGEGSWTRPRDRDSERVSSQIIMQIRS